MERLVSFLRRTPNRTFLLFPGIVLAAKLVASRGRSSFAWQFTPLLIWGYLEYRFCGSYRIARGRGGPGLDVPPDDLVTTGPYAVVRNPMYLGHIIFLAGLALVVRSWLGAAITVLTAFWFNSRVQEDERRLRDQFGQRYIEYQTHVGRWLPLISSGTGADLRGQAGPGGG
jgi:hypothetical protein